jgi:hypothetical protein
MAEHALMGTYYFLPPISKKDVLDSLLVLVNPFVKGNSGIAPQ